MQDDKALETRSGFATIVGRPNVGKSTLLNKLSITSHRPQTTRHQIMGVKTVNNDQIVYVDTPGIHENGKRAINRHMNKVAKSALEDVNAIIFMVQALQWTQEDQAVCDWLQNTDLPLALVVNKVDAIKDKDQLLPFLKGLTGKFKTDKIIPISARNGDNVSVLEEWVMALLPVGPFYFPPTMKTQHNDEFHLAEMVREKIMRCLMQEVPYASTVQ